MSAETSRTRTFLARAPVSPFCDRCGYARYVEQLDRALVDLALDPRHVAIVSDVGCIGAAGSAFAAPHTMHAIPGRSVAFATGIELADAILHDSALKTIVVVGDGGAAAGLSHLLNAALMNIDLTVLVANNGLLALSGGQPSSSCPHGPRQTASASGRLVPPLDLCALAAQCGAGFVARATADDPDLWRLMARAIGHQGFALVEVVAGCPRYAASAAEATDRALADRLGAHDQPLGLLADRATRPEFGELYQTAAAIGTEPADAGLPSLPSLYSSPVDRPIRWVIAGSANEQVDWAAGVLARAAAVSGSHVAHKHEQADQPETGFAVSEVCLSRHPTGYAGSRDDPDVVVVVSAEGLGEVRASGALASLTAPGLLVIDQSLPRPDTTAGVIRVPFRTLCTPDRAAMAAIIAANRRIRAVPERALFVALRLSTAAGVGLFRNDAKRVLDHLHG